MHCNEDPNHEALFQVTARHGAPDRLVTSGLPPQDCIMIRQNDVRQKNRDDVSVAAGDAAHVRLGLFHRMLAASVGALCGCVVAALPGGSGAHAHPLGGAGLNAAGLEDTGPARLLRTGADADTFKLEDMAGPSGAPLPLKIQLPPNPTQSYSFLMFRNMPPNFALSAGFATKDYWAASLRDADRLQIIAPEGYSGTFTLDVLLVRSVGSNPERRSANVVFNAEPSAPVAAAAPDTKLLTESRPEEMTGTLSPPNPQRQSVAQTADTPPPGREMTDIDLSMMERGDSLFKQGDVAAARLLYKQIAKKGIPQGALSMGQTYDPETLSAVPIRGLQPDITLAKNWYRAAEELGSAQAAQRLAKLNGQGN